MRYWVAVIGVLGGLVGGALAQSDEANVSVLVAREPIPRGTILVPAALYGPAPLVEVQTWPAEMAPETAFGALADVEGLVVSVDLPTRTPLLAGNLVSDATLTARVGSDAALLIPEGWRAVAVPREAIRTAPPGLRAGDCVALMGLLDYGGALDDTPWPLTDTARVVENVPDAASIWVAGPGEPILTLAWLLRGGLSVVLEVAPCPPEG